jgi:ComF family protein
MLFFQTVLPTLDLRRHSYYFSISSLKLIIPMTLITPLLNLVFPRCCINCDRFSKRPIDLCRECESLLPKLQTACMRCALPLSSTQAVCGECLKHPPSFDAAWALYAYQSPITRLIKQYKFNRKYAYSSTFSAVLIAGIEAALNENKIRLPELIVPMPQHWSRTMTRGFNQSLELSHSIAKHFSIPHDHQLVARSSRTAYQSKLNTQQRQQNVRNAFNINRTLQGQHISVIDDVLTTCATANAISQRLKRAGAGKVSIWTLARSIRHT